MANYIGHNLLYMDQTIYSYLGLAQKIDPSGVPNTTCLNLGSFGYTPKMFQDEFLNQTSALSLKMLYYDVSTGTQVAYDCIDSKKATALINYAQVQLNVTIPAAVVKTFASLLKASHFDVTFVLSDKLKLTNASQNRFDLHCPEITSKVCTEYHSRLQHDRLRVIPGQKSNFPNSYISLNL